MSRIILLLSCLAALSLLCTAKNHKKRGNGGSKKKKGNKKNKGASETTTSADLRIDDDSGLGGHTAEEYPFSSKFMRNSVDMSRRGLLSAANIDVYKTTRLVLNLRIDLKNVGTAARTFRLRGSVDIHYEKQDRGADEPMILDSWGPKIKQAKVSYDGGVTFSRVEFVDHSQEDRLSKLELSIDPSEDEGILRIDYIAPNSDSLRYTSFQYIAFSDLQNYPILAIFNQPDMARTWVPCQDTIHVKTPVEMRIDVPSPFTVLTSGILVSRSEAGNRTTFEFFQPMSVAVQQLTLTMGIFERWNISERITVWMEYERRWNRNGLLRETDSILKICESMVGPFVWDHLNIVILPDKMGYRGEMLGPNTIYLPVSMFQATSSPIQDDSLVVQELTRQMFYSWFGNLVTAPALRFSWYEGSLSGVDAGERLMVAGIAEYLSYHATAQFLDDRHLADFFFYRSKEYVDNLTRNPQFYPTFKEEMAGARKFSVIMRNIEDNVGGRGPLTKFLRVIVLFSVVDEFSSDEFWNLLNTLFPDTEFDDDSGIEPEGWSSRYWMDCQEVIDAWNPLEGEPVVKPGQLNQLNYVQVAYILENVWHEGLPLTTVKKITSVLKKMGIYRDPNMFYRWALSAIALGDTNIEEHALEYIKNYEQSPGAAALYTLLSKSAEDGPNRKKLQNIERKILASSYVPWN